MISSCQSESGTFSLIGSLSGSGEERREEEDDDVEDEEERLAVSSDESEMVRVRLFGFSRH
jgi:hypothetical protein